MTSEFVRDNAATAAVFGFFASAWFGWAQEKPPTAWRNALAAGSIMSLLIAVAGGILTWRHWDDGTVFDEDTSRAFGIVVGIEFALAGAGGAIVQVAHADSIGPALATELRARNITISG